MAFGVWVDALISFGPAPRAHPFGRSAFHSQPNGS